MSALAQRRSGIGRAARIVAIAVAMAAGLCHAQEKLRVADALPVGHYISEYATKFWMQEVTRRTNGAVQFEYYPAEQLGKAKDMLSLAQGGVADAAYVATSYVSEKLPLSSVAELPGSFSTSCEGTLAYWKLSAGDGILAQREFAPNGVRVLFALSLPPYQLLTSKRKFDTVEAAKGLKIRIPGGAALDAMVRGMGGVPVRIASPELHESLARGTIDGLLFPYGSTITYDLVRLLKHTTAGENFGSAVIVYVMSAARWAKLPAEARKAMEEAGDAATRRGCAMMDKDVESDAAKLKAGGVELVTLASAEKAKLAVLNAAVAREWAEALDKRGKPGAEVLGAYRAALSQPR
jgi:TRAP-type C4-dicarboxylate transport system substrate-binding protein